MRPSLIQKTEGSNGELLAPAPDADGGFVAFTRSENGGGEIVVLTQSLWWHWLYKYQTNSDNISLMRNIFLGTGHPAIHE